MASYGLGSRFPPPSPCVRLLDPGAYDPEVKRIKPNKYPFLSTTPRNTAVYKVYTDKIYDAAIPHSIPNCTSLKSNLPRFPYEAFSQKDLEELLCRCGLDNPCECETGDEEEKEIICQAKVRRRLYIGQPPRSSLAGGLACPSKRDRGFDIMPDGSVRRLLEVPKQECPPFYDTRVKEFTQFYRGCKWSKWKSQREPKSLEVRPGPADYTVEKKVTPEQKCYAMVRAYNRQKAKLVRSMESPDYPGPADYSPQLPKCPGLKCLGPKAERFLTSMYDVHPSPADYSIKRDFDQPEVPYNPRFSTLRLPSQAGFGSKDKRFKYRVECSPGPADYNANVKLCRIMYCGNQNAPFNCSAKRFQDTKLDYEEEEDEDENDCEDDEFRPPHLPKPAECPQLSPQFKSNTLRFTPLSKKLDEPSPADLAQDVASKRPTEKTPLQQMVAPFLSSQGRFRPWYNWVPVLNVHATPGPGYYEANKSKCYPAVRWGPLFRAPRFRDEAEMIPAPNEYKTGSAIDDVLKTHNQRLLNNIKKQHKFHWKVPVKPRKLDFKERELALLDKAIRNLSTSDFMREPEDPKPVLVKKQPKHKEKLLRCFLYKHYMGHCV